MMRWLNDPVLRIRDALVFCATFYFAAWFLIRWAMQ
jgi:hypothetical protein